jgi:hypothetical protein
MVNQQSVFISYAWGGDREEIVNQIDQTLQERGIRIIRDKRDLGYKGSIKAFMESIGKGNCVIVVISDKYLRSSNCMFELVEIAENKQFHDRIFPVVLGDANIYDPLKRIEYVRYWELKRSELAEAIKTLDPANLQGIRDDMDLYDRIRDKISTLTSTLKDMNTLTPEMHQDSRFNYLYEAIEKRINEGSSTSAGEVPESPSQAHDIDPSTSRSPVATSSDFQPVGRWNIQVSDPIGSTLMLNLLPNGTFQATQQLGPMGATIQATGQWIFTPYNNMLQMQGLVNGFQPFSLGIAIQGQQENIYYGIGTDSYGYAMSRS